MDNMVYLDNSSTTKPCKTSVEYTVKALEDCWGNPSSLHSLGINSEVCIDDAKTSIGKLLNCRNDEIIFTGSGTESNNLALRGAANSLKRRGNRIITTTIEHPSVLETVASLEEQGFEVIKIKPNKSGVVSANDIKSLINNKTILISVMLVNNEVGAIQPIKEIAEAIKESSSPALFHCDAVQGFGKIPINVRDFGVDLLSASGHKIHASKGIGFLYKRKRINITPIITGGGQENGFRSGTEAIPLISGFYGAITELPDINKQLKYQADLYNYSVKTFSETGIIKINSPENGLPYLLNISLPGFRSETILHFLEQKNIFVSSGSACARGHGSYVLKEMGIEISRIDSALRISFSRYNTKDDIDKLASALTEATKLLKRIK